jgi:glycosyltransferase involved in cell wall biosynthesis
MNEKVLFIGGTRYSNPLNPTDKKKMKALSEKFDMTYIAFNKDKKKIFFKEYGDFYLISSGLINYFRQFYFLLYSLFKGLKIIKEKKINVIICQSPFEGIAGVLLKKAGNVKLIIEVHSEWDKAPVAYKRISSKLKWITDILGNWSLKRADAIRVISKITKNIVKKYNKPMFEFHTYTDIEVFLNFNEEKIVEDRFLFIGQIIELKGIDTIIEAVEILKKQGKEVEIILIGEGRDEAYFKKRIKELNLENSFIFVGRKPQKEIARYLKTSNALILPSYTEGLGRVILESFASGRPTIGTNVGGIPELIIEDETGYLISKGDSMALADKMKLILNDKEKTIKMGMNGKNFVKEQFSTAKYCESYKNMVVITLSK